MSHEEIVDYVDENNQVLGQAPRSEVFTKKLNFRVAAIIIENAKGEILIQRRSFNIPRHPGLRSISAGGAVAAGESYLQAIKRETKEELGLTVEPTSIGTFRVQHDGYYTFHELFLAPYDGTDFTYDYSVESAEFLSVAEVSAQFKAHPEDFMTSFAHSFPQYLEFKSSN